MHYIYLPHLNKSTATNGRARAHRVQHAPRINIGPLGPRRCRSSRFSLVALHTHRLPLLEAKQLLVARAKLTRASSRRDKLTRCGNRLDVRSECQLSFKIKQHALFYSGLFYQLVARPK